MGGPEGQGGGRELGHISVCSARAGPAETSHRSGRSCPRWGEGSVWEPAA